MANQINLEKLNGVEESSPEWHNICDEIKNDFFKNNTIEECIKISDEMDKKIGRNFDSLKNEYKILKDNPKNQEFQVIEKENKKLLVQRISKMKGIETNVKLIDNGHSQGYLKVYKYRNGDEVVFVDNEKIKIN